MSPAALVFAIAVLSVMLPIAVVAILWPAAVARLNAAAIRSRSVAAPKKMREGAASNSTPGFMRFWGVSAVVMCALISANLLGVVREGRIENQGTASTLWIVVPSYLIGVLQLAFGLVVLTLSRRISEWLRITFPEAGASLRRWMVAALGSVAMGMGATVIYVAISLT